jgi:hypothetical protein
MVRKQIKVVFLFSFIRKDLKCSLERAIGEFQSDDDIQSTP